MPYLKRWTWGVPVGARGRKPAGLVIAQVIETVRKTAPHVVPSSLEEVIRQNWPEAAARFDAARRHGRRCRGRGVRGSRGGFDARPRR